MREECGAVGSQREHDYRKVIIVLSVLLALCLAALGYVLVRNQTMSARLASAIAPDNVISPEQAAGTLAGETPTVLPQTDGLRPLTLSVATAAPVQLAGSYEPAVRLYRGRASGNVSFALDNMLPGDTVMKDYTVEVSYRDTVTLYFSASAVPAAGNSSVYKLEDVLHIKISIPASGEVLYDGPFGEISNLRHALTTDERTTTTVVYRVEASLDTGVGNEYQGQKLTSDFRWWVNRPGNLVVDSSKTGDFSAVALWIGCAVVSLAGAALLLKKAKREGAAR